MFTSPSKGGNIVCLLCSSPETNRRACVFFCVWSALVPYQPGKKETVEQGTRNKEQGRKCQLVWGENVIT